MGLTQIKPSNTKASPRTGGAFFMMFIETLREGLGKI